MKSGPESPKAGGWGCNLRGFSRAMVGRENLLSSIWQGAWPLFRKWKVARSLFNCATLKTIFRELQLGKHGTEVSFDYDNDGRNDLLITETCPLGTP